MSAYDEAIERLADRGPEYDDGLSNHGPMVVEALYHLGRADAVPSWVERYRARLLGHPPVRSRAPVLGRMGDYGTWLDRFSRRLAESEWREVLAAWVAHLLPGMAGAAGHGLLRTSHAARALLARDTPARRHELAQGLAYWAARHQLLPGEARVFGREQPDEVLGDLPEFPTGEGWLITDVLRGLDRRPSFVATVSRLDPAALEFPTLLSAFARRAVFGAEVAPIVYVHLLTASVAFDGLSRLLPTPLVEAGLARLWQFGVAICGLWPIPAKLAAREPGAGQPSGEALIERAIVSTDEHAIKLVDACLTGLSTTGDTTLLQAADALLRAIERAP
jgi:hypothetical protein